MATLTRQDLNFGQGDNSEVHWVVSFLNNTFLRCLMIILFSVVADILCEFLEVAIHLILYVREVYPSGIFQKRKKYNVPVQVRHTPSDPER